MIRFGNIEIIHLPMIVGDNPSAIGVPIAIDWWYHPPKDDDNDGMDGIDEKADSAAACSAEIVCDHRHSFLCIPKDMRVIVSLEHYETSRPVRRTRSQLHWNRQHREEM